MNPQPRPQSVHLISWTQWPLATLFYIWEQSRTKAYVPMPEIIHQLMHTPDSIEWIVDYADANTRNVIAEAAEQLGAIEIYEDYAFDPEGHEAFRMRLAGKEVPKVQLRRINEVRDRVNSTVHKLLFESVPCAENIYFTFHFKNIPVALREQLVRHRIGTAMDDKIGVDIIPDMGGKTSFWSQTMRVVPKHDFFDEGEWMLPETIAQSIKLVDMDDSWDGSDPKPTKAEDIYRNFLMDAQRTYLALQEAGVPVEDARNVLPMSMTHDITWTLNLKAMVHIFGKRACWVAQAGLWEKVMASMVDQMCEKVSPIFRNLIAPPCMKQGKFVGCTVPEISRERYTGRDRMPPCPLFTSQQTQDAVQAVMDVGMVDSTWTPPTAMGGQIIPLESVAVKDIRQWNTKQPDEREMLERNWSKFENLWKLDMYTGRPLEGIRG